MTCKDSLLLKISLYLKSPSASFCAAQPVGLGFELASEESGAGGGERVGKVREEEGKEEREGEEKHKNSIEASIFFDNLVLKVGRHHCCCMLLVPQRRTLVLCGRGLHDAMNITGAGMLGGILETAYRHAYWQRGLEPSSADASDLSTFHPL